MQVLVCNPATVPSATFQIIRNLVEIADTVLIQSQVFNSSAGMLLGDWRLATGDSSNDFIPYRPGNRLRNIP